MLEGRHRQTLPRLSGRMIRGRLPRPPLDTASNSAQQFDAWLVPWRMGLERNMVITVNPGTTLSMDVSKWPGPWKDRNHGASRHSRDRVLSRAAMFLEAAPRTFAVQPSIGAAYKCLEAIWNDKSLEEGDPLGDLLLLQARQLRQILDDLCARPRAVLRTEHRLLKLQSVRRVDAKTLRWLSAQPGRNIAERAGARQRVKAPKRRETIATPENRVLRAFAALTVREARSWLGRSGRHATSPIIEAHQLRALRLESLLRERRVPEAIPPVRPNFPLRFDPRYREIWHAWVELRAQSSAKESAWMWQHRTFMELLEIRAAMKLQEAVSSCTGGGILGHAAVLPAEGLPNQGRYLDDAGVRAKFGILGDDTLREIDFKTRRDESPIGVVATAGPGSEIWWNAQCPTVNRKACVGEYPWTEDSTWDAELDRWASGVTDWNEQISRC